MRLWKKKKRELDPELEDALQRYSALCERYKYQLGRCLIDFDKRITELERRIG